MSWLLPFSSACGTNRVLQHACRTPGAGVCLGLSGGLAVAHKCESECEPTRTWLRPSPRLAWRCRWFVLAGKHHWRVGRKFVFRVSAGHMMFTTHHCTARKMEGSATTPSVYPSTPARGLLETPRQNETLSENHTTRPLARHIEHHCYRSLHFFVLGAKGESNSRPLARYSAAFRQFLKAFLLVNNK